MHMLRGMKAVTCDLLQNLLLSVQQCVVDWILTYVVSGSYEIIGDVAIDYAGYVCCLLDRRL